MEVVFGLDYPVEEVGELAQGSFDYIAKDISDIRTNYIRLGFHLNECELFEYYKDFGYFTFADFVFNNFGLDKSALSKCINVFRRFSVCENNIHKMFLQDAYSEYSYSQLCEMLPLSSEELKRVSPAMTVKQIRDYKKSLKNKVSTSKPVKQDVPVEDKEDVEFYSSISEDEFVRDLLECSRNFIECNFSSDIFISIGISGKRLTVETGDSFYCLQFSQTKKKGESA